MILMNDFQKEPAELMAAQLASVEKVLRSGWYILGQGVKDFESDWAGYCATKYAIGVANGLDAIEIGLRSLGLEPGAEVITTPVTAFATVLGIKRAGLVPVLADIDPETGVISPDSVQRCVTAQTRALLLVHLYGRATDMQYWTEICSENKIALAEDCAQSHGAKWASGSVGTFGKFGAWSFYPTKNLGAIGDAGALTTNDCNIAERAQKLRNYGQSERYHHPSEGMNSRLDELQAAILTERLKWLDVFTERRREIATRYWESIKNNAVKLLKKPEHPSSHVHHLFVLKCDKRDALIQHLKQRHVCALSHYPIPIHHQAPCADIQRDPNGLFEAERFSSSCVSIPCHPQMTDGEVNQVIDAVNSFQS